jgi:hypothetical protein
VMKTKSGHDMRSNGELNVSRGHQISSQHM